MPHQQTLGQLQRWNYQRGPTSKGMWADLQQCTIKCTMDSDKKELAERRCVNVTEIFH